MSYDLFSRSEDPPGYSLPGEEFETTDSWTIEEFDDVVPTRGDETEPDSGLQV